MYIIGFKCCPFVVLLYCIVLHLLYVGRMMYVFDMVVWCCRCETEICGCDMGWERID